MHGSNNHNRTEILETLDIGTKKGKHHENKHCSREEQRGGERSVAASSVAGTL